MFPCFYLLTDTYDQRAMIRVYWRGYLPSGSKRIQALPTLLELQLGGHQSLTMRNKKGDFEDEWGLSVRWMRVVKERAANTALTRANALLTRWPRTEKPLLADIVSHLVAQFSYHYRDY